MVSKIDLIGQIVILSYMKTMLYKLNERTNNNMKQVDSLSANFDSQLRCQIDHVELEFKDKEELVEMLLEAGADINVE